VKPKPNYPIRPKRWDAYMPDWIRISDCPFSKAHVYRLIKAGMLKSAVFDPFQAG